MKIAYFDLTDGNLFEDYSYEPKRYGGARIIASSLLEKFDDFHIYGHSTCFENVRKVKKNQCFNLDIESIKKIKHGYPIQMLVPNMDQYDIVFHHSHDISINLSNFPNIKEVVWPVGWRETLHYNLKNILAFDIKVQETLYPPDSKVYNIVIGPKMPPYEDVISYDKEDFIFQCSRHCDTYQSAVLAQLCVKNGIKAYFAGPIDNNYPLLNFIDNKNTFYLGVIPEKLKIEFYKRAKVNTQLQTYPISATLSGKQAASYGNVIFATKIGGWEDFIVENVNGFFINSEEDFLKAWSNRNKINITDCYKIASQHSEENMISSVLNTIQLIFNDR